MTKHKTVAGLAELVSASDLLEDLQDFMLARQGRVDPKQLSDVHADLDERRDDVVMVLEQTLDEQGKQALRDLLDALTSRGAADIDLYYRCGFADGIMTMLQSIMLTA